MASAKLTIDSAKLSGNLTKLAPKLEAACMMVAQSEALRLQSYMMQHRPWTDRTGQAKATLNARVSKPSAHIIRITLAHGVSYGIWLELAHGKKYAIVKPTIDSQAQKTFQQFNNLISKVAGSV